MEQITIKLSEIKIIGINARTRNELEMNPETALIGNIVGSYFQNNLSNKILNRKKPGVTFSIFTDYESDFTGNYTYFIGEEVESFDNIPEGFSTLLINSQTYTKFTAGPGPMPNICIETWQKIWQMNDQAMGGKRNYHTDFEIYDERSADRKNTILDIYIGLKE